MVLMITTILFCTRFLRCNGATQPTIYVNERWIMMNAAALAFVLAGSVWAQPDGQVMFILILTLAAAEACIGLAIVLQFYHRFHHLDVDAASEMRG